MSEASTPSPELSAAADLVVLLRLIADPKEYQARLDRLTAGTTRAIEARAAAERAEAALAKRSAELDRREAKLDAARGAISDRSAAVEERHRELRTVSEALRKIENIVKWRVANHAGAMEGFDPSTMTLPSWDELDEVLNPIDAHFETETVQPTARRISPATATR